MKSELCHIVIKCFIFSEPADFCTSYRVVGGSPSLPSSSSSEPPSPISTNSNLLPPWMHNFAPSPQQQNFAGFDMLPVSRPPPNLLPTPTNIATSTNHLMDPTFQNLPRSDATGMITNPGVASMHVINPMRTQQNPMTFPPTSASQSSPMEGVGGMNIGGAPIPVPNFSSAEEKQKFEEAVWLMKMNVDASKRKPHQCSHCKKRFSAEPSLSRHIKVHHSDAKPFECNICGKTFLYKQNYHSHMNRHSCGKNYACDTCGKLFIQLPKLQVHIRDEHPELLQQS